MRSEDRRRVVATLAGFAAIDFALGALVQSGAIRRLPDPPVGWIDSRAVMMSRAAFPLGIPDAPLALALEAGILALCGAAQRAPRRARTLDRAIAALAIAGGLGAVRYGAEMVRMRRACVYCIAAAGALFAMIPFAVRNVRRRA